MRSMQSLKTAVVLGLASLTLTSYAANGLDVFMNGQSYYGQSAPQTTAARVVDIAASGSINTAYGETVTFRSGGQQFSWTFSGLGGRAVDLAKIAPAGFASNPFTVYIGRDPMNRR